LALSLAVAPKAAPSPAGWQRPVAPVLPHAHAVPGHNRWHPAIPAAAEVISGGSVRLECQDREPGAEPILCGPISIVGAEPGDVIVVDILAVGRSDGRFAGAAHPGVIGCAPALDSLIGVAEDAEGALLGHVPPGPDYDRVAARALRSSARGSEIGGCAITPLTAGSRILLPVRARGGKLSVGDLHFPPTGADDCAASTLAGWVDLRINLTKRGVERFSVHGPLLMPDAQRL
jgi:formamidase